jgi:hypothetical protein
MGKISETTRRPTSVTIGVLLFFVALGLAGIRSIMEASSTAELLGREFMLLMLAIIFAVSAVMILLIVMMACGRNWARISLLALFLVSALTSTLPLLRSFSMRPVPNSLGLAQLAFQLVAMTFLFRREASAWFRFKSKNDEPAPSPR